MLKLVEMENGKVKTEEVFESLKYLKKHLMYNDYLSWVLDNEPERELPDFSYAMYSPLSEIVNTLKEFDYSWWKLEVLEECDPIFFEDCGDYDIKVFRFEDDTHYLLVDYHKNVRLDNKIIYLTEKQLERLQAIFKDFDNLEMDEQSSTVRFFEDEFHI